MRVPQLVSDKISNYVDAEDFSHQQACWDAGVAINDYDNPNELPWYLDYWFPEHLKADGLHTYRTFAWGEIWECLWGPTRKTLKLCKIGWHGYFTGYKDAGVTTYRCMDCRRTTRRVPRWAR